MAYSQQWGEGWREEKSWSSSIDLQKDSFIQVFYSHKQKRRAYFSASIHLATVWELLFICAANN